MCCRSRYNPNDIQLKGKNRNITKVTKSQNQLNYFSNNYKRFDFNDLQTVIKVLKAYTLDNFETPDSVNSSLT